MADNLPSKVQNGLGMMPGTRFYSGFPFSGMNTQASPIAMDDREFKWRENFIRLGDGNLRTVWDVGPKVYTAPTGLTIVSHYEFTLGSNYGSMVFLSDGSAVQIDTTTGVVTTVGSAGLFYTAGGSLPACAQWGVQYLLISNRNTPNDYWVWDGRLLYQAGTAAPNGVSILSAGENYTSVPTATAYGGHGTGMSLTAVLSAGGVVNVTINNPGFNYEVGDVVQVAFSGGGSDTSAILVANLSSGGVAAANITGPGSGYTHATVAFSGGGGSGAAATAVIGSGVSGVTITNQGAGYTHATVAFSGGGGSGAVGTVNITGGQVTSITINSPGTGYTTAPTATISGDGTGAAGTATIQGQSIIAINITNPGSGYTSAPGITITGDGTGATAVAILTGTDVASVTVQNGGTGFVYAPNLSFVGGNGTGAAGVAVLAPVSIARINVTATGANYSLTPTVTISSDAGGSGAVGTPVMMGGKVVAINLTNAGSGYTSQPEVFITPQKNDTTGAGAGAECILQPTHIASVTMTNYGLNYTDAPSVQVQSGANKAAYAVISLMPFGVSGDSMETFQQRVWIANPADSPYTTLPPGGNWQASAPSSFTDFATSDGGSLFTNSDGFLQTKYTAIKQSNGYLYFFGDGSVSVVSNVQTSGNPATTVYNYQNVDPQTGAAWRDSLQEFGRTILMANETGVFGIYGGAATSVSKKLEQLFTNAIFPPDSRAISPTAAVATLFDMKVYLLLMTVLDPDTNAYRNVMITWNEETWAITTQTVALTYINSEKRNSLFTAWGTDGSSLYRMFQQPSSTLVKRLDTKLFGSPQNYVIKDLFGIYVVANDKSGGSGISIDLTADISGLALQSPIPGQGTVQSGLAADFTIQYPVTFAGDPTGAYWPTWGSGTMGASFINIGLRLTSSSPDFVVGNLMISYADRTAVQ